MTSPTGLAPPTTTEPPVGHPAEPTAPTSPTSLLATICDTLLAHADVLPLPGAEQARYYPDTGQVMIDVAVPVAEYARIGLELAAVRLGYDELAPHVTRLHQRPHLTVLPGGLV